MNKRLTIIVLLAIESLTVNGEGFFHGKIAFVSIAAADNVNLASSVVNENAVDSGSEGTGKEPVTLVDLPLLADPITAVQLSPDNKRVAIVRDGEIELLTVPEAKFVKALGPGLVPIWAPSGNALGFYSTRSGEMQLWVWNSSTDELAQVTQLSGGIDVDPATRIAGSLTDALRFSWSPNGRQIVMASRVAAEEPNEAPGIQSAGATDEYGATSPLVLTNNTPRNWTLAGIFAHPIGGAIPETKDGKNYTLRFAQRIESHPSQLFVLDVMRRKLERLTNDRRTWFNPDWSPDGRMISGVVVGAEKLDQDTHSSDVVLIDVSTRRHRFFDAGPGLKFRPRWSPDGASLAYLTAEGVFGWPALKVGSTKGKVRREHVQFNERYIYSYAWTPDSHSFLLIYKDGPSNRLGRINLKGAMVRSLSAEGRVPISVNDFGQSRNGAVVWQQFDPESLSIINYLRLGAREPIALVRANNNSKKLPLGAVETVAWRNSRGDYMQGTMLLPPEFRQDKKYPLIVDAYPLVGGTGWAHPMMGNYAWASMGYVVFRPSPRAPHVWMNPWTTQESSLAGKGVNGWQVTIDDVTSATDELIRRGMVDPSRMCLYGFSNGAAVVNYLVTRMTRFACAVSVAPAISDWVRPLLPNHAAFVESLVGLDFEKQISMYVALSPMFQLSSVQTPMLLASGDNDGAVLDSIEMYNGLRGLGKEVFLLRYPDQGHGFTGAAMADFWEREMAFFEKYLRPTQ